MSIHNIRNYGIVMLLVGSLSHAMTFDNRFIPLIQHPYVTVDDRPSYFTADLFMITSRQAYGPTDLEEIGIPELYGQYDEQDVAAGIVAIGKPNPLRSGLRGYDLPWTMTGKIQGQGIDFSYRQQIGCWFSVGLEWFFMHINSHQNFFFKTNSFARFSPEEREELDDVRRSMNDTLGLTGPNANQIGLGDILLYARAGGEWNYLYKFRHVQAGARLGFFMPTGQCHEINSPASIPFGGNGHYGIFGATDAEFELKEDWKLGALVWVGKRFARTSIRRMPVGKEPAIFGPVVGPARVSPGVYFVFSPYVSFENLREGLGARIQYTLTAHDQDLWCDMRADKTVPVNLDNVMKLSRWASDYVTLTVFYDFGKVKVQRKFEPIVIFSWDVPVSLLVAHDVAKTNRVSLGLQYSF